MTPFFVVVTMVICTVIIITITIIIYFIYAALYINQNLKVLTAFKEKRIEGK